MSRQANGLPRTSIDRLLVDAPLAEVPRGLVRLVEPAADVYEDVLVCQRELVVRHERAAVRRQRSGHVDTASESRSAMLSSRMLSSTSP